MAQAATKTAPKEKVEKVEIELEGWNEKVFEGSKEHLALTQEFDPFKKYMFELANENPERELPVLEVIGTRSIPIRHQKYKPFLNIVFTSQIIWKGQRRILRYYDGCDTIFADKQPKEKETIDQFVKQTKRRDFLEGKFGANGDERMLLIYLNICSWNAKSEFRTRSADQIFVSLDVAQKVSLEASKLDEIDHARDLAKNATEMKMKIHASYLGIPMIDYDSGNELTQEEIRIAYRKAAIRDASGFIESYGNKKLEIKYFIDKALADGLINTKFNPNKALWAKSNSEICDISGLRSNEGISEKLFEFSQLSEGEEFAIQIRALYDN
jgi:hypothetical protein